MTRESGKQKTKKNEKRICQKAENLTVTTTTANAATSVAGKSNVATTFGLARTKPVYDAHSVRDKKTKKDKLCRNDAWTVKNK